MKKIIAIVTSALLATVFFVSVMTFDASAASSIMSLSPGKSSYEVGDTVTVTVKYNAGSEKLYGLDGSLTYNSSVMKYVSGGGASSNGTVKIVDTNLSGESSSTYTIVFKAIASGDNYFTFSGSGSNGTKAFPASAGATANVKAKASSKDKKSTESSKSSSSSSNTAVSSSETTKKSNNADLSSLSLSVGTLSPTFKSSITSYEAEVLYSETEVTINAAAAKGTSTFVGAGTYPLNVGDNKQIITVTAQDGTKKSYSITIKRLKEGEKLSTEDSNSNPYEVIIDGESFEIVPNIKKLFIPTGYTVKNQKYNDKDVQYLSDDNGKYSLFYLKNQENEKTVLCSLDDSGEFEQIDFLKYLKGIIIIEEPDSSLVPPSGFTASSCCYDGTRTVSAFSFDDAKMEGFYMLYAYVDGVNEFFRYDSNLEILQRDPQFSLSSVSDVVGSNVESKSIINKFFDLGLTAKLIVILTALAILFIFVLIILLIVKISSTNSSSNIPKLYDKEDDGFESDNVFVFGDDDTK